MTLSSSVIPSEARNRTGPDSGIGGLCRMSAIPRLRLGMTSVARVLEGKRFARNNVGVDLPSFEPSLCEIQPIRI